MAIELSLDAVDNLAQEDYADIAIPLPSGEAVTLVHPLRMTDENRKALTDYFESVEKESKGEAGEEESDDKSEDLDLVGQAQELLTILVDGDPSGLFDALAGDVTKYQAIVKFYFEKANPGEA